MLGAEQQPELAYEDDDDDDDQDDNEGGSAYGRGTMILSSEKND